MLSSCCDPVRGQSRDPSRGCSRNPRGHDLPDCGPRVHGHSGSDQTRQVYWLKATSGRTSDAGPSASL